MKATTTTNGDAFKRYVVGESKSSGWWPVFDVVYGRVVRTAPTRRAALAAAVTMNEAIGRTCTGDVRR